MMQFTDQIQRAFAETVRSGLPSEARDLPARLRDFTCDGATLDVLWSDLLHCYRTGPRQAWATVLLEAMRPDLAAAVAVVPAFPPVVTREDYAQQLMANLLAAALDGPVDPARWTPNRLISRAGLETQRWLAREIRGFARQVGYVDQKAGSLAKWEMPTLLLELEMKKNPSAGLVVLYREEVLGESLVEIAAESGLSEEALRSRRRRAVERRAIREPVGAGGTHQGGVGRHLRVGRGILDQRHQPLGRDPRPAERAEPPRRVGLEPERQGPRSLLPRAGRPGSAPTC